MSVYRSLLAGLGLLLAATSTQAQVTRTQPATPVTNPAPVAERAYPQSALGLTLGWGAPYGWGIDYSYMVTPKLDVNAGLGFTITGAKIGLGTRYYFAPQQKVSPFIGANLVHNSGISRLTISDTNNQNYGGYGANDQAIVNYNPSALLHLRGGIRWQPVYRFAMIGALGYGINLGSNTVEYIQEPTNQTVRDAVNLLSPGGLEFSVGVAFGLGSRY